jgi:EAL domain-containing protein (putative c-di-GMP-specific phosphodiesterase class I)
VVLEITERAALAEISEVQRRMARLRAMGFRIALDDLGAGYAGLTNFTELRPEIVKLDQTLVRGIDSDSVKRRLVASLVGVCRDIGTVVVAEGIETPAERDVLVDAGCDLLQGYLLGRPARL